MKITNSEIIKNAEQELLDGIIADLDWSVIEKIIKDKHRLELEEDVEFKKGDLVVIGDRVGYKLDFQVKLTLSILLDREGNHISTETGESSEVMPATSEVNADKEALGEEKAPVEETREKGYEAAVMAMEEADVTEESVDGEPHRADDLDEEEKPESSED